ncbi:MAG: 2-amino-4-hydroxy-6-hydroxymethyldihydropteridine diphosphokinase [Methylotenera sp.]|nr:2-amino-4-hydroxy-6-hydroxymethyldihydropteridine diphosphokinase [Methylotenera sp.]
MKQAFIALGSNLADPLNQINIALAALANIPKTQLVKKSSLYRTAPVDCPQTDSDMPDFINAVAELATDLTPLELLDVLLSIETKAGRERPYRNAPRVLDCDLLLYENTQITTEKLTVPHPRMHARGFVLLPLFEIAPQLSIPNHGKISELIQPNLYVGIQKLES